MNPLDLIRTAHEIDGHLAAISAAVTDDTLKKDLFYFHERWRALGYRISANLCGLASNGDAVAPKRRGRPRRIDAADVTAAGEDREEGALA